MQRYVFGGLLALLYLVAGPGLLSGAAYLAYDAVQEREEHARIERDWTHVEARVTERRDWRDQSGDRVYSGTIVYVDGQGQPHTLDAGILYSTLPETYDVWYDPDDPSSCTLAPDGDFMGVLILGVLGGTFTFGPLVVIFRESRGARRKAS